MIELMRRDLMRERARERSGICSMEVFFKALSFFGLARAMIWWPEA